MLKKCASSGVTLTLDLDIDSYAVSHNDHSRRLLSVFHETRNAYFSNPIDVSKKNQHPNQHLGKPWF